MQKALSMLCCLVLCSAPALAQKADAGSSKSDQQFVDFAAQTDMVEANLGQLAQNNASSQAVKDYGQMLVTDHTNDFNQLAQAAQQAGVNRPDAIDKEHDAADITPMEKLHGEAFDKKFIHEMVVGHTAAIAKYKKEAADAQNTALKNYAETALPVLEKHLDRAKELEKSGGK